MAITKDLYETLKTIFIVLDDGDRRFLGQHDLNVSRYYALYHLGEEPGISFRELSQHLLCDKSNTTRIIKHLEASGLVQRQPHETDGRSSRLFLTDRGRQTRQRIVDEHSGFNDNRFGYLPAPERSQLLNTLKMLKKNLQSQLSTNNGNKNGT